MVFNSFFILSTPYSRYKERIWSTEFDSQDSRVALKHSTYFLTDFKSEIYLFCIDKDPVI